MVMPVFGMANILSILRLIQTVLPRTYYLANRRPNDFCTLRLNLMHKKLYLPIDNFKAMYIRPITPAQQMSAMRNRFRYSAFPLLLLVFGVMLTTGCNTPEIKDSMEDADYKLVNHQNSDMTFPEDFEGSYTIVGYIYTHCPDVCPLIISNMKKIQEKVEAEVDEPVQFVAVSFDPERDDPKTLRKYFNSHDLGNPPWTFLTGDTTTVNSFMDRMGIFTEVSYSSTTESGEEVYFITHTDRVSLFDKKGRLRQHYRGSSIPPEVLVEDIHSLK